MLFHDAAEMLQTGLELVGFQDRRQNRVREAKNRERFATFFVASPEALAALWLDVQRTIDFSATKRHSDYFLCSVHVLAKYPTENELEATFKWCDRTIRDWVWYYWLPRIQSLKEMKISWPRRWSVDENDDTAPESTFIVTVDGVHCPINEPSHGEWSKNPEHCSHKFGSSGLNCEIAISIYKNKIVWTNGPFKAGKHTDIKVFRAGLKDMIPKGKLVIADLGYRGEHVLIATPNSHDSAAVREFKSMALARHETFNGKIKLFQCLSHRFRHGMEKHKMCFEAVAVIGVYMIENGSPLFDV